MYDGHRIFVSYTHVDFFQTLKSYKDSQILLIEERLKELGIKLEDPPAPAGSYIPTVTTGNLLFVSGQIPVQEGRVVFTGKVSDDNMETAQRAAKLCGINILSQIKRELGDLERIVRIVKLSGYVNSVPEFTQHPKVINAASDLFFEIFGQRGKHSRVALGATGLPLDSMTEIDAIVEFS